MELSQALGIINLASPEQARNLADLIPEDLIRQALTLSDTVTLRKRKLPLESMIWLVVGMSVFCNRPLTEIVNLMDIDNAAVGITGNRTGGTEKVLRAGEALRVAAKKGTKLPTRSESKMQKVSG